MNSFKDAGRNKNTSPPGQIVTVSTPTTSTLCEIPCAPRESVRGVWAGLQKNVGNSINNLPQKKQKTTPERHPTRCCQRVHNLPQITPFFALPPITDLLELDGSGIREIRTIYIRRKPYMISEIHDTLGTRARRAVLPLRTIGRLVATTQRFTTGQVSATSIAVKRWLCCCWRASRRRGRFEIYEDPVHTLHVHEPQQPNAR